MWIALAIVVCMILHLVDRNQKWAAFWKVAKLTPLTLAFAAVLFGLFTWYETNRQARAAMTPDSYMAQHSH